MAVKPGDLYQERTTGVKFPRVVKVKKIKKLKDVDYVYYMAENTAAQVIHPNGGFAPVTSFVVHWTPYTGKTNFASGNGSKS